jgi:hypothetical protein
MNTKVIGLLRERFLAGGILEELKQQLEVARITSEAIRRQKLGDLPIPRDVTVAPATDKRAQQHHEHDGDADHHHHHHAHDHHEHEHCEHHDHQHDVDDKHRQQKLRSAWTSKFPAALQRPGTASPTTTSSSAVGGGLRPSSSLSPPAPSSVLSAPPTSFLAGDAASDAGSAGEESNAPPPIMDRRWSKRTSPKLRVLFTMWHGNRREPVEQQDSLEDLKAGAGFWKASTMEDRLWRPRSPRCERCAVCKKYVHSPHNQRSYTPNPKLLNPVSVVATDTSAALLMWAAAQLENAATYSRHAQWIDERFLEAEEGMQIWGQQVRACVCECVCADDGRHAGDPHSLLCGASLESRPRDFHVAA